MNFTYNEWSIASTPSFADTTASEIYPNFSANGDTLFFSSNKPIKSSTTQSTTLWYVTKTADGWSEAKVLDTISFEKDIYASSVSKNGTRYFTIGPHGTSDWNIYKKDISGNVDALPPHINSKGYEDGPFISLDESYLIFESDRPSGTKGNIDLYISFRTTTGTWTVPMNMGPTINTTFAERFARVSPDGQYLFFGRKTGKGFDIYWIDAGIINQLKKQAIEQGLFRTQLKKRTQ